MNPVRFLLSMRCMLLMLLIFEPRAHSRSLGMAGTVMTIGLSINGSLHSKVQFDERT